MINFFEKNMEYISIFIEKYTVGVVSGLIAAILILVLGHILRFIKNIKISKKYSGYIGKYYLYNYSLTGVDKVLTSKLCIKTKFGKLIVRVQDGTYNYSGIMRITERGLYINYEGIEHIEQVNLIFYSPLYPSISHLIGIKSAISPIEEPVSTYCILSNIEMEEKTVIEKLLELSSKNSNPMLKVLRDNTLYFYNLDESNLKKYSDSQK